MFTKILTFDIIMVFFKINWKKINKIDNPTNNVNNY
jgi:hypothetical protein